MKELGLFLSVLAIILLLSIPACKKDCTPDPPPDSIPDTSNCHPTYYYLSTHDLTYYNFIFQSDSLKYYKTVNNLYLFDRTPILLDTVGSCSRRYEYYSAAFLASINVTRIDYIINPFVETYYPENFIILIGASNCQSYFKISTGADTVNLDSIQLLDKTFYDVYYRTEQLSCASEMYYNKQYGVVGFNWQGEWYVLETDSL